MKILIVDDNVAVADTFEDAFHEMGHEVKIIGNKGKCLETLPALYTPDAVLMDASMPQAFLNMVIDRFKVPIVGITGGQINHLPAGVVILEKPELPAVIAAALQSAATDPWQAKSPAAC